MSYTISRIDGVVGGFISLDCDIYQNHIFEPVLEALHEDMRPHSHHEDVRFIFHPLGDPGVAEPLNTIATMGWKCNECTRGKTK